MVKFNGIEPVKNKIIRIDDKETEPAIKGYLEYIYKESTKGKMPLIIVGAGISSSDVYDSELLKTPISKGLPTLIGMIKHIYYYIEKYSGENSGADLSSLQQLFLVYNDFDQLVTHIDREWLSKAFTTLANSKSESVKNIWKEFCTWFLFECIDDQHGALNTQTTKAAKEIQQFAQGCKALCFSANFDNYLTFNMKKPTKYRDAPLPGMSIFSKHIAEKYFSRTRRHETTEKKSDDYIENECVIHANGDVFWLSCSGDAVDGYCPKTNKYLPAYSWVKKKDIPEKDKLVCDICHSSLQATMTMPGTYKKDHDTREMLSAIWKYVSSKVSTVITIGISCNWDDVLLKFIIGLLFENNIPHLDINNRSEENIRPIELHEKIVKDEKFFSFSLYTNACDGVKYLNQQYEKIQNKQIKLKFEDREMEEIRNLLSEVDFIQKLKHISQIGLKGYWLSATEDNNRWEHSMEVAKLALDFYNKICANSRKEPDVSEQVLIYISGLLHDCGHLPFSHLMEDVFSELSWKFEYNEDTFNHHHYTAYLIKKLFTSDNADITEARQKEKFEKIRQFIQKYNVEYKDIIKVINGNYGIGYIDALINSEIDCDKIAYLFKDSSQTNIQLLFNSKEEFLNELLKNAYITEEGLIALDSESAWIAFRMLDERKRLYNELYYADDIRCLELAVKYIVITYFVQQYNEIDVKSYVKYKDDAYGDLSHCRIMMAIDDLFSSANAKTFIPTNDSLSKQTLNTLSQCMGICLGIINKRIDNTGNQSGVNGNEHDEPKEITILKNMYAGLTGNNSYKNSGINLFPYTDNDLNELSEKLSYEQLFDIRKKIHLNFPGVLLIDVHKPAKYLARAKSRQKKFRIDGTEENQVIYLVPPGHRNTWHNNKALAGVDISDYVCDNNLDDTKCTFNVYKLSSNETTIEHAINMLKKEMETKRKTGSEAEDE